ncbi:hypothetical protein GCM10010094_29030 [Streptomyces flaveus]|uniref:Uncharacterized protein n=1 Tax=Streptomyces flaveus TaxID=66370 RepID=A0A917VEE7_9ACTN|nr:hypothetical protein GCM10010094_29030 [Streptomyces flaveus]
MRVVGGAGFPGAPGLIGAPGSSGRGQAQAFQGRGELRDQPRRTRSRDTTVTHHPLAGGLGAQPPVSGRGGPGEENPSHPTPGLGAIPGPASHPPFILAAEEL